VKGNQVNADVGGNLNIVSVQDTLTSAAHQSSSGGGFNISQGSASASFSQSKGNATGSYAGVNEQAGIHAGDGGFNINVTGNTDLKGGLIASDADASKNSLTTGSLSFSDIQNQSHYDASSSGFSAGATTGDGGMNYSTHGGTSGKNAGGAVPMLGQNDSGSDSATTKSGVSAGTVTITDSANQKQDVASLNRDTTNTNGTVAKLPDMQNLLSNHADMMAAASAAGEAVSRRIGDYADEMKRQAQKNGDQAGVDAWKEGGANRALMQGAGAALVTGLAGGKAVGGAAGAAVASIASGKLNELSSAIAGSDPTGNANMNQALGNIVANALATGAGAAVGGESGAFSGYNVDRFNRQLHPDEYATAKQNAKLVSEKLGISVEQAEGRIVAEILRNSDKQTTQVSGGKHDYEIRSIVGCQNLNCYGYKNDPKYANHDYNSQYIKPNQGAYDRGQQQLGHGQTYNELVTSNMKKDPVGATVAGAGLMGVGLVMGGPFASAGMMGAGGLLGLGANGGVQLMGNQSFDWTSFALAGATGAASTGMKFIPVFLTGVGGALTGSALQGQSPNSAMAGAAVGTAIGYPIGAKIEGKLNDVLNPWYRQEWVDVGMGVSKYVPPSVIPSWVGGFGGGVIQEKAGGMGQNKVDGAGKK
ncbi:hemagglutinin repeat-containing protein, partial [Burkholderia paludis]|uniref:hemagglutinin repeat-containing protein n=1 Tax=Burkholderia paludis TaxID=1506587 RepID=UPI001F42B0ED